jgi:2-amino-4-hydroxy-6-hydroxymethyldihydropteridine diphosphokinase
MNNNTVFIALGTNIGARQGNLQSAIQALQSQVRLLAQSNVYQTAPVGYLDQADFLNQVIKVDTSLSPEALLRFMKAQEREMGRQKTFRDGPRVIDLDILFYSDLVLELPDLHIPHPRLHERAFVLVPLADIAPEFVHPLLKLSVSQLLINVGREGVTLFQR